MKLIKHYILVIMIVPVAWTLFIPGHARSANTRHVPPRVVAVLNTAHGLIQKKNISRAAGILESFQKNTHKKNHHYLVYFALGNCYVLSKRLSDALAQYENSVKINPDYPPAWMNLGRICYDLEKFDQAGACFYKGYTLPKEKNTDMLYYSAVSYLAGNRPDKALKIMLQLLTLHRDSHKPEWKEIAARIYLGLEKRVEALHFIQDLAENSKGKKKKQWQETLLYQYISLDMAGKALTYAQRLTREDPLYPRWWKGLVHLHLSEGHQLEALTSLTVYRYLVPLTEEEKIIMADLSLSLSIPAQSIPVYEEVLKGHMDTETVKKLAYAYIHTHHPEKAIHWIEKGIKKSHDQGLLSLNGNLLYEMKKYPEAAAVFEKLTRHKRKNPHGWMMLGYASMNAGQPDKARAAFQKALKYPNYEKKARDALKYLDLQKIN